MGLPAGRGTKLAGTRAGLLFPETPGMSKVTSISGPSTILFSGVPLGLLAVNFVVRTNDTSFWDVVCADRLPETSSRMAVPKNGKTSFLMFELFDRARHRSCVFARRLVAGLRVYCNNSPEFRVREKIFRLQTLARSGIEKIRSWTALENASSLNKPTGRIVRNLLMRGKTVADHATSGRLG